MTMTSNITTAPSSTTRATLTAHSASKTKSNNRQQAQTQTRQESKVAAHLHYLAQTTQCGVMQQTVAAASSQRQPQQQQQNQQSQQNQQASTSSMRENNAAFNLMNASIVRPATPQFELDLTDAGTSSGLQIPTKRDIAIATMQAVLRARCRTKCTLLHINTCISFNVSLHHTCRRHSCPLPPFRFVSTCIYPYPAVVHHHS